MSAVWKFFDIDEEDNSIARCKLCVESNRGKLSRGKKNSGPKSWTMTPLINHLTRYHNDVYQRKKNSKEPSGSSTNSQPTITESLSKITPWGIGHVNAQKISAKIMCMIALDNQPFSIVEDKGFVSLINHLQPRYTIPSRRYFSETLLNKIYDIQRSEIQENLNSAKYISLTSDIWTAKNNESFISLSGHWLTPDFTYKSAVLNARHFPGSHTADNISKMYCDLFDEWDISKEKVHLLLRDGARNMSAGSLGAEIASEHCFIHKLQPCINDAVLSQRAVKDMLARVRKLVGHFKHSSVACTSLKEIQREFNFPVLMPVQDIQTRWNSTYYMLDRATQIERAIKMLATESNKSASRNLCLLSEVIPNVMTLEHKLGKVGGDLGVQTTKAEMLRALQVRFTEGETSVFKKPNMVIATLLDPRFKTIFLNDSSVRRVKQWILDEFENVLNVNDSSPWHHGDPVESSDSSETDTDVWSSYDEIVKEFNNTRRSEHPDGASPTSNVGLLQVNDELESYLKLPVIARCENPHLWWKTNAATYPKLVVLAIKSLSAPASSVYSERMFSEAGLIYEEHRSRLLPRNAEKLLFIHHNANKYDVMSGL